MKAQQRVRRALAVTGVATLGVGLALAAPMTASAATTNYTLDCFDVPYSGQTFYVADPLDTVTFTLTNFTELYDYATSSPVRALDPLGDTVVVGVGDELDFWDPSNACIDYFDPTVEVAEPETVPSGSKLFTQAISISSPAGQIDVVENDGGFGEHFLAGDPNCGLSTEVHGSHVYSTLDITVLTAGTYTFKGLFTNPAGYYVGLNEYDPIGDPFLAVYSTFDPASPDAGVVGCNDDLNDLGTQPDAVYRADGTIIEGHVPYFTAAFVPGQYTLVLMTWEDLSSSDLAAGYAPWEESDFQLGTKSTTFELWGPAGGLALGHVAFAALPPTGVDQSYGVVALSVTAAGLLLLAVSRRRKKTA